MEVSLKTLEILATVGVISILIWITLIFGWLSSWLNKKGYMRIEKTETGHDIKIFEKDKISDGNNEKIDDKPKTDHVTTPEPQK